MGGIANMVSEAPELLEQEDTIESEIESPVEAVTEEVATEPDEEESAPAPRGIDDLSDDELSDHPRIRELARRREQAARDRLSYEAEQQRAMERQQWLAQGGHIDDAAKAVAVDEAGNVQVNRERMADIIARMDRAAVDRNASAAYSALDSIAPFRQLPAEKQRQITDASNAGRDWLGAYVEAAVEARVEAALPDRQKQWEKEYKAKMAKATEAQSRKAADATNATAPRPTAAGGTPAKRFDSFDAVEEAYLDGEVSHTQYKKYAEQFGVKLA